MGPWLPWLPKLKKPLVLSRKKHIRKRQSLLQKGPYFGHFHKQVSQEAHHLLRKFPASHRTTARWVFKPFYMRPLIPG